MNNNKIVSIFKKVNDNCPAYHDFFSKNGINNQSIIKKADQIPISNKEIYFNKYTIEEKIYKNKEISDFYMICTSSGSTGEPTLWPRDIFKDEASEKGHTKFLDDHFNILNKKTLIVISFGLGTSTAGTMHARLSWEASKKANISVITPNIDIRKSVSLVNLLYKYYEQVVFIGYPPLISEIINLGIKKKLNVKDWNCKIAGAGSGMTKKWRKETAKKISKNKTELNRIVSFFGCTETGMLGMETTEVNKIINICIKEKGLIKEMFGIEHLPTIVEMNIPNKYIEIVEDDLVLTVDQPIPLVRYNVQDKAAFLKAETIKKIFDKRKIDFEFEDLTKVYLVVFGRKEKGLFVVEDFKHALENVRNNSYLLQEFQFKEEKIKNKINISLVLYERNDIKEEIKKQIESDINRFLNKKRDCFVKFIWKKEKNKIGFKSGKLRYYL